MSSDERYLWPVFKTEYIERITRIRTVLDNCYSNGFSTAAFDAMYQELDSINGASRVVNREDLGELARLGASYTRFLRCNTAKKLDDSQLLLLEAIVVLCEKIIPIIQMESDVYCLKEALLPQIRHFLKEPPDDS